MKLAITVHSNTSINNAQNGMNVQGDEMIARGWQKYLVRNGIEVDIIQKDNPPTNGYDAVIHFDLFSNPWPDTHNILYFQNVYPPEAWPGGTIGQFNQHAHKYQSFMFTSAKLRDNCNKDGAVVPFAVDPEIYTKTEPNETFAHPACFVGNAIRSRESNIRYLGPAIEKGLAIYGNPAGWPQEFASCLRGKISQQDEVILYNSADICLNCHIQEHILHDTLNYRVYCILACEGLVVSDSTPTVENEFKDYVISTTGNDHLQSLLDTHINNKNKTVSLRVAGREYVLANHTFKNRVETVFDFVRSVI